MEAACVSPLSPPCSSQFPELPFRKQAAADYVRGSGLCKDAAGSGGTGGTEEHPHPAPSPAPSRTSGAGPDSSSHTPQLPNWDRGRRGKGVLRNKTAMAAESGMRAWVPDFLCTGHTSSTLWVLVSLSETPRRGGLGNLQGPSQFWGCCSSHLGDWGPDW